MLTAVARDPDHLELARRLGLSSVLIVPLTTGQGPVFGAITFARGPGGSPYGPADLALAEELGHWAARIM
jgi:GAF domain-containing protein